MNEQWRGRMHNAKRRIQERVQPFIDAHVPADMRQDFKDWQDGRRLNKLDFTDYQDELSVSFEKFEATRAGLIKHVRKVFHGDGGRTRQEADATTAARIDTLGQHFHAVASQLTDAEDTDPIQGTTSLAHFVSQDEKTRYETLMHLVPGNPFIPSAADRNQQLWNIIYTFADPAREWGTDPTAIARGMPMSREEAVELYKQLVAEQIDSVLWQRQPNIHEQANPNTKAKKALTGLATASVVSLILIGDKRLGRIS